MPNSKPAIKKSEKWSTSRSARPPTPQSTSNSRSATARTAAQPPLQQPDPAPLTARDIQVKENPTRHALIALDKDLRESGNKNQGKGSYFDETSESNHHDNIFKRVKLNAPEQHCQACMEKDELIKSLEMENKSLTK